MRQDLVQSHKMLQEQIMAPQQIQSLEILLAPLLDLQAKVTQELQENPALELINPGGVELMGDLTKSQETSESQDADLAGNVAMLDESMSSLIQLDANWKDYLPYSRSGMMSSGGSGAPDEEKRQHFFDSLTSSDSLQNVLDEQLRTSDITPSQQVIAEQILGSIDSLGYLRTHPADLAIVCNAEIEEIENILKIIQKFDPPGIAARDLQECLCLQLERLGKEESIEYKIAEKYLDFVKTNKIMKISKELKVSANRIYEALETIRKLQPYPGSIYSTKETQYVIPETFIEQDGDEFEIRSSKNHLPNLKISDYYMGLLENKETPIDVKKYIQEKLSSGKMLIKSIDHRKSTIMKISEVIATMQKDFFIEGVDKLVPVTMSQVADEIGVHETTVSRAIASKYIQTPRGLFPFKYFFTTGFQGKNGEVISSLSIKQKIHDLIRDEEPNKPLADQTLVDLLKEEGFKIARRTVAKYREELDIPSSHLRRSYSK